MEGSLVVISDLHVGANDGFDIFSGCSNPALLSGFLTHISNLNSPVELVINGDFVDFLQLKPWDSVTRTAARDKVLKIVSESRQVFLVLGAFLRDPRHSIRVLIGNHDPELAFPEVGNIVREAIAAASGGETARFCLEDRRTTYNPSINGILAHIEHGNDQDPWNDIGYQRLFADAELGTTEFSAPPGTQLVYEIMNSLKENLRFVDLLKPEMPAIPLLLVALKPFQALRKVPRGARKLLASLGNAMVATLRERLVGQPLGEEPGARRRTLFEKAAVESILAVRSDVLPDDLQDFLKSPSPNGGKGPKTLGPRFDYIRLKLLAAALEPLARFQATQRGADFYDIDHPHTRDSVLAHSRLRGNVKLVIFGHTHEALKTEFPEGVYVNSGTWANVVQMPAANDQSMLEWLRSLSDNSFARTAFPTYVKLEPSPTGAAISLNVWKPGENVLWRKNITQ